MLHQHRQEKDRLHHHTCSEEDNSTTGVGKNRLKPLKSRRHYSLSYFTVSDTETVSLCLYTYIIGNRLTPPFFYFRFRFEGALGGGRSTELPAALL